MTVINLYDQRSTAALERRLAELAQPAPRSAATTATTATTVRAFHESALRLANTLASDLYDEYLSLAAACHNVDFYGADRLRRDIERFGARTARLPNLKRALLTELRSPSPSPSGNGGGGGMVRRTYPTSVTAR
jgi:hypothetical protein